jgi:hypothetical protein
MFLLLPGLSKRSGKMWGCLNTFGKQASVERALNLKGDF